MSWSKSPKKTGNASVSNERLRDGNRLAGKGLMSSISPLLPTQAGQTQMPARAPPWSLSPITQLGMSVSFKIEREIDVDFTFIPHCLQKTVCWPVAVSIHFWLDLCPSWDWRADHESANPFSMVPGPASIQPLLAVVLGLRKTSSDNLLITPKLALPAFALFPPVSLWRELSAEILTKKKMCGLKWESNFPYREGSRFLLVNTWSTKTWPLASARCANTHIK